MIGWWWCLAIHITILHKEFKEANKKRDVSEKSLLYVLVHVV
jgi:hypothetical protein